MRRRIDALRDRQRALKDGVLGIGVIAVGGRNVGLQLRLQVGGIELREQLSRVHRVALANVNGIGGFGERALDRDVLVGRDDAGELARGLNRSEAGDRASARRAAGRAAGACRAQPVAARKINAAPKSPPRPSLACHGIGDCTESAGSQSWSESENELKRPNGRGSWSIDDERGLRELLEYGLGQAGFEVR